MNWRRVLVTAALTIGWAFWGYILYYQWTNR